MVRGGNQKGFSVVRVVNQKGVSVVNQKGALGGAGGSGGLGLRGEGMQG